MNSEDLKRWGRSILISLIVFAIFSVYLYLRRGYYNVSIINKALGSSSVVIAGFTLLIGPLSRKFSQFVSYMIIRRHLGLIAFALALLHVIFSLYQTERFEWFSWYIEEWIPVTFGIIAVLVWSYMAYISRNVKIAQMGSDKWKKTLSITGNIAFLAVFLHLTVLKYQGWIDWFNGDVKKTPYLANPTYVPASIFVFIIMLLIIVYRAFLYFKKK